MEKKKHVPLTPTEKNVFAREKKKNLTSNSGYWFFVNTSFFCYIRYDTSGRSIDCSVPFVFLFFNPSFLSSHINGRGYFLTFMFVDFSPGTVAGLGSSPSACQLADAEPRAAASSRQVRILAAFPRPSVLPLHPPPLPPTFADLGSEIGSAASALLPTFHPGRDLREKGPVAAAAGVREAAAACPPLPVREVVGCSTGGH